MAVNLPSDVTDWLLEVFRACGDHTARKMSRIPTVHETSLDFSVIEHLTNVSAPFHFESEWLVRIDTHFLGGMRHYERFEIADLGLLIHFRHGGKLIRTKLALLQSKRLYPNEEGVDFDGPMFKRIGFGALHAGDDAFASVSDQRQFTFTADSGYRALKIRDDQYKKIDKYEETSHVPVYYSFYNPLTMPFTGQLPVPANTAVDGDCSVGFRVIPAQVIRDRVADRDDGTVPTYGDVISCRSPFDSEPHLGGWRLEHFVVNELIACNTGYRTEDRDDSTLSNVFFRRSGPISAAIAIGIDCPANKDPATVFGD